MVGKLGNINKWPNFSYFSHSDDGFVPSNTWNSSDTVCSMEIEEFSLAQLGFQEIDLSPKEESMQVGASNKNNNKKRRRRRSRRNRLPPRQSQQASINCNTRARRGNYKSQIPLRLQPCYAKRWEYYCMMWGCKYV